MENTLMENDRPVLMPGESLVLFRLAYFSMHINSIQKKSQGQLFLTTLRIVFYGNFTFEIPLATIEEAEFHQPLCFANTLTGKTPLLPPSVGTCSWCFAFHHGVGTFMNIFFWIKQHFQNYNDADTVTIPENKAFVDPNAPSVLFVSPDSKTDRQHPF